MTSRAQDARATQDGSRVASGALQPSSTAHAGLGQRIADAARLAVAAHLRQEAVSQIGASRADDNAAGASRRTMIGRAGFSARPSALTGLASFFRLGARLAKFPGARPEGAGE